MQGTVYKVFTAAQWDEACGLGRFDGSSDDERDGFIHLSTARQLPGTLARHFADQSDLVLAAFDAARLGAGLRWEPARDGSLFPHLYGSLDPRLAGSTAVLRLDADGRHVLPGGLV